MGTVNKLDRQSVKFDAAQMQAMQRDPRVVVALQRRAAERATNIGSAPKTSAVPRVPKAARPMIGKPALALSGGGAKGSFQIGALKYLYEERGLKPKIVVGTSVGSINGVKLAEGEGKASKAAGHQSGLVGLTRGWLDIKNSDDMFREKSDFAKLKALAANADELREALESSGELSVAAALTAVLAPGLVHLGVTTASMSQNLQNLKTIADAAELAESFLYSNGLVHLGPVKAKLEDPAYLDVELVQNSGIDFRAIWVGMLSGQTYCTDAHRRLYRLDDPRTAIGSAPLRTSVLASSAQPMFMDTPIVKGEMGGKEYREKGFDGGVREIVGIRCAQRLGATETFAILCQPLDNELASIHEMKSQIEFEFPGVKKISQGFTYFNAETKRYRSLFELALRATDLTLSEVLEDDLASAAGEGTVHVIRPYIEVHDGMTLLPGLLRANMDHGWMCAFDLMRGSSKGEDAFLRGGNLLITENRREKERFRNTQQLMKQFFSLFMSPKAVDQMTSELAVAIQECNARIAQGIAMRRAMDPDSLPTGANDWDD